MVGDAAFTLVAFRSSDWNGDFSPWAASAIFGKDDFAGNGQNTLRWLTEECIPAVEGKAAHERVLVGYSLSGLFALWAGIESEMFKGGIACCSGSLWFPGWMEFIQNKTCHARSVYLSLGQSEEKTKNKVMAAVGNNTRQTYDWLCQQGEAVLEWNKGGHFNEPYLRVAKGIAWLIKQNKGE